MNRITMSEKRILILGASGHAAVVAELIQMLDEFELIGFVDDVLKGQLLGLPIVGAIKDLAALCSDYNVQALALGIGDNFQRHAIFKEWMHALDSIEWPALVHPRALVSPSVKIGVGSQCLAFSSIGTNAQIGDACLVNTAAVVEHDGVLGPGASLGPSAVCGGNSSLGENSYLGMGALLRHGCPVGNNTVVGMGAVVTQAIPDNVLAYGNPAKVIRKRNGNERYL